MSNLFGAPMDHGPLSVQTGFDELGRPIYRTPLGSIVGEAIPEPPRQNALASILRTEVDPFTGRAVHYRDDLQPTRTGNALAALLQGVTQGLTAPGRAARGQPVTLGDVWSTALDAGALAAPMPAPRGAIRAGAMGTEGPADEIARMLREGRASEITDDMMARLSPEDNVRLFRLYEEGATGQPMPMDEASRMARAREMGFDQDAYRGMGAYSGGPVHAATSRGMELVEDRPWTEITEINAPGQHYLPGRMAGFSSDDPAVAARFQSWLQERGAVFPLRVNTEGMTSVDFSGLPAGSGQFDMFRDVGRQQRQSVREAVADPATSGVILKNTGDEGTVFVPRNPQQYRSRFARFDPRLSHLAHLSAGGAGVAVLGGQEDQGGWDRARQYLREIGALE